MSHRNLKDVLLMKGRSTWHTVIPGDSKRHTRGTTHCS
jgi:hypothetical protein